jgi:NAD(P)-dependent dehydrogenase (short-subunit alcohol dehydrogenase family)
VINIASLVAGRVGLSSASYAVSKAAVLHMTRAQAFEWARHGIRVNAISPGYIHSEMTDAFLAGEAGRAMIARSPQRRAGDASDLDGALLLLASRRASGFMTGADIAVDGGHALA